MPIVVLELPDVKRKTEAQPRKCPYCGGGHLPALGQVNKPVKDMRARNVKVCRYHC